MGGEGDNFGYSKNGNWTSTQKSLHLSLIIFTQKIIYFQTKIIYFPQLMNKINVYLLQTILIEINIAKGGGGIYFFKGTIYP